MTRRYFSTGNMKEAALLGGFMTLLSTPRILTDSALPLYYLLATFFWLVILSGTVTAWGRCAGMKGYFPSARVVLKGLLLAFLLVLLLFPLKFYWFNPLLYQAVEATGNDKALALIFPVKLASGIALTLWVMSFEMLFFQAAAISFFARLTRSLYVSLLLAAIFRTLVTSLKLQEVGVESDVPLILLHAFIINAASCLLFARYGLPASMLFVGGISLFRWNFLWG